MMNTRYYFQRVTQSKSELFFLILWKKQGHLTQVEKGNLFENLEEIVQNVYDFYSRRNYFALREYFPLMKLLKQYSNYHFHFLVIKKGYAKN